MICCVAALLPASLHPSGILLEKCPPITYIWGNDRFRPIRPMINFADLRLYWRLLAYLKPHKWRMTAAVVAMLGVSALTALLAYMVKPVLDDIFFAKQENMLYWLSGLVVVLYLVKGFLSYTHNYQMSYIGNATVTRLRDELFAALQRQPLSFFDGEATGVLMSRLTYDVNLLQDAVTRVVTSFFKDTFTVMGLTAVIFYREWRLAIMAMVVFPLAVLVIVYLGKRIRRISQATQVANAYLYTVLQESLIGQRIVKAFAREDLRGTALLPGQLGLLPHPHAPERHPGAVPAGDGVFGVSGHGRHYFIRRLRGHSGLLHPRHLLLLSGRPPHALPAHQEPEFGAEHRPGGPGRGGAGLRPHGPGAGDSRTPPGPRALAPLAQEIGYPGSPSPTTAGTTSSTTSTSPCAGAKWWPWWAPPGPANPPC